jgi:hypothetical protein
VRKPGHEISYEWSGLFGYAWKCICGTSGQCPVIIAHDIFTEHQDMSEEDVLMAAYGGGLK